MTALRPNSTFWIPFRFDQDRQIGIRISPKREEILITELDLSSANVGAAIGAVLNKFRVAPSTT
ncbi:MAG TPA: hypothetical protein VGQ39_14775 [Pyrinomonadaceae bacterium]|jgi:hypothetical protein|nr:hypothetical protein [Pyrinomonadaceae bacterium]